MKLRKLMAIGWALTYVLCVFVLADGAPQEPLSQVIEGAKKEGGEVSVKLASTLSQAAMYRLEKEIKGKYGVDLRLKFTSGSNDLRKTISEAVMEQKVGAIPTYDLLTVMGSHIAEGNRAGAIDPIDWKPLLSQGTNPGVVLDLPLMYGGMVYYTGHEGIMYNPEKIKVGEVPKTLADLGDPKWKGRGGLQTNLSSFARMCFIMGKDKVLPSLRAILKNGAIQGEYTDLLNRYLVGEIWWCTISSSFLRDAQDKGMPAGWQSLDFASVQEFSLAVRKGARHANSAKLVALHLVSPEGAKFMIEEGKCGNVYYPGNFENDIRVQDQKARLPEVFGDRPPGLIEFYVSPEGAQLMKEIQLILQTGGQK